MTANTVAGSHGGAGSVSISCDQCGTAVHRTERCWAGLWAAISGDGWTGSTLPVGPHRCPRCSTTRHDEPSRPRPRPVALAPASAGARQIEVRDGSGITVCRLTGDLDTSTAGPLHDLLAYIDRQPGDLVLDVADVRLIDSTALRLLVRIHRVNTANGRIACLATPSRFLRTVLRTMRLETAFPQFPTVEAAVSWLANQPPRRHPS